ncbi:MAG: hypothetical protein J5938_05925 [Clostridia bacterium]|nr:hypothetical protein [Clostridia bacterium]
MPKYIDADALLAKMERRRFYVGRASDPICIIEDMPAADVIPLYHGCWIEQKETCRNGDKIYQCSVCGYADEHSPSTEVPFCWHCGARMDGKKENNGT